MDWERVARDAVGALRVEAMGLPGDTGLTIIAYSAEQGSPSEAGLRLLASWTADDGTDVTASTAGAERRPSRPPRP